MAPQRNQHKPHHMYLPSILLLILPFTCFYGSWWRHSRGSKLYFELGLSDVQIVNQLSDHYDTGQYSLRYVNFYFNGEPLAHCLIQVVLSHFANCESSGASDVQGYTPESQGFSGVQDYFINYKLNSGHFNILEEKLAVNPLQML